MFSKTCEYGIKAMVYLWQRDYNHSSWAGLEEISTAIDTPKSFTAKVLQSLARSNLCRSIRGRNGGFAKVKNKKITLADIVVAIDGERVMKGCILGFQECSEDKPCVLHQRFSSVRDYLNGTLISTDIDDIAKLFTDGHALLKED